MGGMLPEKGWQRVLMLTFYAALFAFGVWITVKYLITALLPFLLACLTAALTRPLARWIGKRTMMKQSACGAAAFLLLLLAVCGILVRGVILLLAQASSLAEMLSQNADTLVRQGTRLLDEVMAFLPESMDRTVVREAASGALTGMLTAISAAIPAKVGVVLASFPGTVFFLTVYLISSFVLCMRYEASVTAIAAHLPDWGRQLLLRGREQLSRISLTYLKSAVVMFFLTLFMIYLGLRLLSLPYALLISVLIAFVDLLPVLGAGTVLLPWAIVALTLQDFRLGGGLLILFALLTVVRQTVEPRIVGKSMGLSPLVTLTSMYAGFSLFGFWGMLLLPLLMTLLFKMIPRKEGREAEASEAGR